MCGVCSVFVLNSQIKKVNFQNYLVNCLPQLGLGLVLKMSVPLLLLAIFCLLFHISLCNCSAHSSVHSSAHSFCTAALLVASASASAGSLLPSDKCTNKLMCNPACVIETNILSSVRPDLHAFELCAWSCSQSCLLPLFRSSERHHSHHRRGP